MNRSYNKRSANEHERDQDSELDSSKRIEQSIYELGNESSQSTTAEKIDEVAQLILREGSTCPDAVIGSIVACLLELPHKTEMYATLFGILNVANRELVGLCLDRLSGHISNGGEDLKWWHLIQLVRIVVELTNVKVFSAAYLDAFLQNCATKLACKSESGELMAVSVLLALPWISADILGSLTGLQTVMQTIGSIVNSSDRCTLISKNFDVKIEGFEAFGGDSLTALFGIVSGMKGPLGSILKTEPYKAFESSFSDSKVQDGRFNLDSMQAESISSVYVSEFKPLELFSDVFEDASKAEPFVAFYYQFMLHMLIEAYELNHRRGAEILFSCLPEILNSGVHVEKALCQVLFGKLMRSRERTSITYYEVLLIDCCRLSRMFPPMMARSLMIIVAQMDEKEADLEVVERLAGWFAHHLSHYDFKWNWSEWQSIAESSGDSFNCKRLFLRCLIYNLLLLSYQEKMQSVLPDYMLKMMPSLSAAAHPSKDLNEGLLEFMKKRPSATEIKEKLADDSVPLSEAFEVFLVLGSKTFSHLSSATDRYASVFTSCGIDEQRVFLQILSDFWADNIQNYHLVLEKMISYKIISMHVMLDWTLEQVLKAKEGDFEVEIFLKLLSSDLLFGLLGGLEEVNEKVSLSNNLISRFSSFGNESDSPAIKWLSFGLVKTLLRVFYADKSAGLVAKTEGLIPLIEDPSNPENVKIMLQSVYKVITMP